MVVDEWKSVYVELVLMLFNRDGKSTVQTFKMFV